MKVIMGQMAEQWGKDKNVVQITLCLTENCNLRCTYCYLHKNVMNVMSLETAINSIDFILSDSYFQQFDGVILDFIGGEPTLEMDLLEKVCDYFITKTYRENHKWFNMYRFLIGTNGLLYGSEKMQNFINKHQGHLYVGLSIDGNKTKHDISRVKIDGGGSYDDIIDNVKLWVKQFQGAAAKSTFSHEDLPYLKDSIIHLWDLGINFVHANIIYENVWKDGDVEIFEEQLRELADYIIKNDLWYTKSVTFFNPDIGLAVSYNMDCYNVCGTGHSIAIDCEGTIFPCHRFFGFTQKNSKNAFVLGHVKTGLDANKMRALQALTQEVQSDEECNNCDIAGGCGWCSGYNYSELGTVYKRVKYKCEMHKAQVRVNKYLWNAYSKIKSTISPHKQKAILFPGKNTKYLYILTDSEFEPICNYNIPDDFVHEKMDDELFDYLLDYCDKNNYLPVIVGDGRNTMGNLAISHTNKYNNPFTIYINSEGGDNILFSVTRESLCGLGEQLINKILTVRRIVLIFPDFIDWNIDDLRRYENEMKIYLRYIIEKKLYDTSVNVINDLIVTNSIRNCNSGITNFTVAPNGRVYYCAAFYYNKTDMGVSLDSVMRDELCEFNRASLCKLCNNVTCRRCIYHNKMVTGELSVPSKIQCLFMDINRNLSYELYIELKHDNIRIRNHIQKNVFADPMEKLICIRGQ